jgi:hypothetical protein
MEFQVSFNSPFLSTLKGGGDTNKRSNWLIFGWQIYAFAHTLEEDEVEDINRVRLIVELRMGKVINLVGLKLIAFGVRLQSEDQPS